ncbi:MAG: NADPH-dependent oxidoreductase [Alphaproteobacteria bacterium]|nr:MAG: NADPH-dependent oxidoreductase [Alphaproteobacteria bacterium]TAF76718.1 MAG: NADPH-dependent oxidoreductase [Alphaproteobacteria bacterium]
MISLYACAASHRAESINRALLDYALGKLRPHAPTWQTTTLDYADFILPPYDDAKRIAEGISPEVQQAHDRYAQAQAWMFAVPEYNSSCPGAFKNTIDWLSVFQPNVLSGKPVILLCATPSERGGVIGLMHTRQILESVGMMVYPTMISVGKAHEVFRREGAWTKPAKQTLVDDAIKQFCTWGALLHHGLSG